MALIDRAELFNRLSDKWDKAELYAALQGMPEVDAEPVRRGKWEAFPLHPEFLVCSSCYGAFVSVEFLNRQKWNFCPVCGADMREEI